MQLSFQFSGGAAFMASVQQLISAFTTTQDYRITTNVEHALYQEYGTIHHGPQPHFRPAVQAGGGRMSSAAPNSLTVEQLQRSTAEEILAETRRRAPVLTGELRAGWRMEAM